MENTINQLFELQGQDFERAVLEQGSVITNVIGQLDRGEIFVCEQKDGQWTVNQWVKKAILLYFRSQKMELIPNGPFSYFDKIPLKKWDGTEGVRVVPQALARQGSYIDKGAILMPSYVNIGAYVGKGTLVDTWATVGSCAWIGSGVHLSGGVGVGGVLEPLQASPVIVEDNCFIGSRAILVEGVQIKKGAVIGAGVTITGSTRILDVSGSEVVEHKGIVPENSVVIPGTRSKTFSCGEFQVPCALIIGQRKESTDKKTSLNQVLRDFQVTV